MIQEICNKTTLLTELTVTNYYNLQNEIRHKYISTQYSLSKIL